MKDDRTGGPAFPGYSAVDLVERNASGFPVYKPLESQGMSLRDYFAAKAMQMLRSDLSSEFNAARAYEMADAMLAERAKK